MSSENISASSDATPPSISGEGFKSTTETTSETSSLLDSGESGNDQPDFASVQNAACPSSFSPFVNVVELPVSSVCVTSTDPGGHLHFSADRSGFTNIAAHRVVECEGCAARRIIYHTCGGNPHEQLPYCEYTLLPESLRANFNVPSLRESGEGALTYSVQSPVSVTRIQHPGHSHGPIPFAASQPVGVASSPHQHDCSHCVAALDRRNEVDLYSGDPVPVTAVRHFVFGVDVSRPCPVHVTEAYTASFSPTFDIPLARTYSNIRGHPYLPRYYIQTPQHPHSHPLAGHVQQGLPYLPPHAGHHHHHHCCSGVFQNEMHDGRYQFTSHYDSQALVDPLVDPDDHLLPTTVSSGTREPSLSIYSQKCDDSEFVTNHPSATLPDVEVSHRITCEEEPTVEPEINTSVESSDKEPRAERPVQVEAYQIREPEAFFVSSDVTIDSPMDDDISPAQVGSVAVSRNAKSESLTFQDNAVHESCVDGNRLQTATHFKNNASDIVRSHTPPERDVSCSQNSDPANFSKTEDGNTLVQELPNTRGMAFTIDFGHNQDNPEITEHWKQFMPYRTHAGIQQRASKSKSRLKEKSESMEGDQQKATRIASAAGPDGYTKTRRRSAGSHSVGGYISDGQASGISSENEDASICSEVMGCIQGRRKLTRSNDPRSFVDRPYPSRSQSSLVKVKPSSKQVQPTSSGVGGHGVRPSKGLSGDASASKRSASASKKTVDIKPNNAKTPLSKNEPVKRAVKSAKSSSEITSTRRLPKRPCDDVGGKDEEILDVTSYLINRMLFSDKSSNGYKTKSKPLSGGAVTTQSSKSQSDSTRCHPAENIPDNVSGTGTYTIEDDGVSNEVQKARDDIDVLFGIGDAHQQQPLIHPVIESTDNASSPKQHTTSEELTSGVTVQGEDVFEYEPDANIVDDYKLQVSEAVSSAISATKAIQKALLQKSSKSVSSSDSHNKMTDMTSQPSDVSLSSDIPSSDVQHSNVQIRSSEPSSAAEHAEASDERDFGTFTVSFDVPSPQIRDSKYLSRAETSCATDDDKTHGVPLSDVPRRSTTDVELLMQSVDATVQELHDVVCKKGQRSGPSGGPKTPFDKPSREATFVKDVSTKDNPAQSGSVQDAQIRPLGASSGQWRREHEASDAGSESETGSLSSMDYSTKSCQFSHASMLRSSGGRASFTAPLINRTFALRCSKATVNEAESVSLVPRSKSAGTDRLALRDAGSRSASRSRSRPRILSPASNISLSQQRLNQQNTSHRRTVEQQHSEDSSASICSSISSRSSTNFVRKDGGRYSMRSDLNSSVSDRTKMKNASKPKSAGGQTSSTARDRPGSAGSATSQRSSAQSKELDAWKRRKQYDPRKAVAEARAKGSEHGISELKNQSAGDESGIVKKSFTSYGRSRADSSAGADEIAELSSAVAYNLNVLAESTQSDSVTLSSYDNVLVNSIQQVSHKVQVLTDQLITKVRDEKRRGASGDGSSMSPQRRSGSASAWGKVSPDLSSILENLKRTEHHLQGVHKTLFVDGNKREATDAQRQADERQRTVAESRRFRPIERPSTSGNSAKKRSPGKKLASLSTNPLSGDEYY